MVRTRSRPGQKDQGLGRRLGLLREKAFGDHLFLAREVLGYDLIEYDLPLHQQLSRQATHIGNSLTLIPRGFLKTTFITVSGSIFYHLHFPEDCTLITSWTLPNAKKFLSEITQHFTQNENFRILFEEFCPKGWKEEGTQEQFCLPNRKKPRREATFEAAGANQSVTSRHYEVINVDDAVVEQNVPPEVTEDTMHTVTEWFRGLRAVLKTVADRCFTRVIGTRWHDGDLYGKLVRDEELMRFYKTLIVNPWDINSDPVWPSRFSDEKLAQLKAEMKDYMWACLMMQDPLPPESAVRFEPEWFSRFEGDPPEGSVAITVDPAFTEAKSTADRSAIIVTVVPEGEGLWIDTIRAGRWSPDTLIENIIAIWQHSNAEWVGVEKDGGGRMVFDELRRRIQRRKLPMRLVELRSKGKRKPSRIAELQAYIQQHGCWYRERDEKFMQEILRYPIAVHDDIPDALAYRVLKMSRPRSPEVMNRKTWTPPSNTVYGRDLINWLHTGDQDPLRRL